MWLPTRPVRQPLSRDCRRVLRLRGLSFKRKTAVHPTRDIEAVALDTLVNLIGVSVDELCAPCWGASVRDGTAKDSKAVACFCGAAEQRGACILISASSSRLIKRHRNPALPSLIPQPSLSDPFRGQERDRCRAVLPALPDKCPPAIAGCPSLHNLDRGTPPHLPVILGMNAVGTKAAVCTSTSAMPMTRPEASCIALSVPSRGERPGSM
jgi:hypothetical protein